MITTQTIIDDFTKLAELEARATVAYTQWRRLSHEKAPITHEAALAYLAINKARNKMQCAVNRYNDMARVSEKFAKVLMRIKRGTGHVIPGHTAILELTEEVI